MELENGWPGLSGWGEAGQAVSEGIVDPWVSVRDCSLEERRVPVCMCGEGHGQPGRPHFPPVLLRGLPSALTASAVLRGQFTECNGQPTSAGPEGAVNHSGLTLPVELPSHQCVFAASPTLGRAAGSPLPRLPQRVGQAYCA